MVGKYIDKFGKDAGRHINAAKAVGVANTRYNQLSTEVERYISTFQRDGKVPILGEMLLQAAQKNYRNAVKDVAKYAGKTAEDKDAGAAAIAELQHLEAQLMARLGDEARGKSS